jgi:hypothetical protein
VAVRVLVAIAASLILASAAIMIVTALLIGMMAATGIASGGHGIERVVSGVLD